MDGVSSATKPETVRLAPGAPPVLVLDSNVLRNEVVIERCIARYRETGAQFALPEMVMFELTKHPEDWEANLLNRGLSFFHAIFQIMDEHVRSYDPARTIRAQLGPEPPANWTIHYDPARGTFTISDAPPT